MCKCNDKILSTYCMKCVPVIKLPKHVPGDATTRRNEPCGDPIVEANVNLLRSRSEVGLKKYGVPLGDIPSIEATVQHALEEVLDLGNYLQTVLTKIRNGDRS